ncbi:hypothetical protein UCRPA7_6353 [Phaeoacremonium minimum UCRPA7]|uniref:Uncharacterized protein n=1 Tax=Phaeoacremonium minimum (strain UCR-PA7) TaxID=1286976 RepID=R8BFF6_PHAM7|nr:hypothetical protein UCRPA7_6353 [Phaeoacremonium minimum UCRPA7]EON98041.1 hypothetical protein UCRPA7_6353 [Phaeoacremonium minimum UCRPA7]
MYLSSILTALVGFSSIVAAAPAHERDVTPVEKGLKYKSRAQKRSPLIIQQSITETQITVIENNLDTINQLALIAEQEFAALVQSQIALITEVETIKNNIRVNHFKARWPQVNTVIVTVTNVVDLRDSSNKNNRYLINQLLADNAAPESQIVVMVTALDTLTVGAVATPTDLSAVLASASAVSNPTATPAVASFDQLAPFGQLNQSVLLPFNSSAPSLNVDQVFVDPAAIILPNQALFVSDVNTLNQDCALVAINSGSLFNLQAALLSNLAAVAQAELAGLILGQVNPTLLASSTTSTATETATSTSTDSSTSTTATAEATGTAEKSKVKKSER